MRYIHLIGNAHLDPVWLWRWQEGFAEIKATFRSALDRMKEFDDFKFTSACSAYYMWIEKSDPAMFEEIRQRVREGRWEITGGWLIQPDCNLPSGESFARHALISQRYFKEKFGITAKTGYNVDSFGHNGSIPKLMKNSGMDNYVYMRPMKHEKELPEYLFRWHSADGSTVLTYRIPEFYNIDITRTEVFERVAELADRHDMMAFYGVGNHGGGATIELLDEMHRTLDGKYIYSTTGEFFERVKDEELRIVEDDLQFHAKGCYSAVSEIKTNNRRAENMLLSAEAFGILSAHLSGSVYPAAEFERAWKNVLFNQFHDILGGCCIAEAYDDARMFHNESMAIAAREQNFALQQISWNIDTTQGKELNIYKPSTPPMPWRDKNNTGTPAVVFNPLAYSVSAAVTVGDMPKYVTDDEGRIVPFQTVRASKTNNKDKYCIAFMAEVPALGYSVYRLHYDDEKVSPSTGVRAADHTLENDLIKAVFDPDTAEIVRIEDKRTGSLLCDGSASTLLIDETNCDTWAHDISRFKDIAAKCTSGTVKVTENGPVRATVRCEQFFENTHIIRDYSLTPDSDAICVRAYVDFREKHRMLKFGLPLNAGSASAYCEIPYGFISRPGDGSEQPMQGWAALTDGKRGLGIASSAQYSFDAEGETLYITMLRGAIYADHFAEEYRDEFCEYMDQGEHRSEYSIFPYTAPSNATKRAQMLNNKPVVIEETFHKGALGTSFSGIEVSEPNVIVTALKKHEDTDAYILRCYEADNRDTRTKITLFGKTFEADFGHNEVKTFIINKDAVKEADFMEWEKITQCK